MACREASLLFGPARSRLLCDPAECQARTLRRRLAWRRAPCHSGWSDPELRSKETNPTFSDANSCSVFTKSTSERPQRSSRQTTTRSISRLRAAASSSSRFCRRAAPEPTSFTSKAICQPRLRRSRAWRQTASAASAGHAWKLGRRAPRWALSPPGQKPSSAKPFGTLGFPPVFGIKLAENLVLCHVIHSFNHKTGNPGAMLRATDTAIRY